MKFIFPCKAYEERAKEFIRELYDYHSDINGSGALDSYLEKSTCDEWLKKVASDIDLANVPDDRAPAYTYFYADDAGRIVGMINIRLQLNDFLLKEGGHIGYCIRSTEQKKGYAVRMLEEALLFSPPYRSGAGPAYLRQGESCFRRRHPALRRKVGK